VDPLHEFYSRLADKYEESFEAAMLSEDSLKSAVKKYASGKVLDAGCGNGRWKKILYSKHKKRIEYIGVDANENLVEVAMKNGCDARVADIRKLPFDDCSFDTVICLFGVLSHMDKESQMLAVAEMERVLKEDGIAILSVGNYYSPFSLPWMLINRNNIEMNGVKTKVYNFKRKEFLELFGNFNFKLVDYSYYDYSFVPIQLFRFAGLLASVDYTGAYRWICNAMQETSDIGLLGWMGKQMYGVFRKNSSRN